MSPGELKSWRDALDDLAVRVEVRSNPFVVDIEDGEPEDAVRPLLERHAFQLFAADALVAGSWSSATGDLVVSIASSCASADGARCVPLWGPRGDEEVERARFFAWPLARAAVIRVRGTSASSAARSLRDVVNVKKSTIALVLTHSLDDEARVAIDDVRVAAQNVQQALRGHDHVLSALLASLASMEAPPPFFSLEQDEVLFVPRLAAVGDPAAFARDVQTAMVRAGVLGEWIHQPAP